MPLTLTPNLARPDDVYARLIALTEGLGPEDSLKRCAKLILILANHVGDETVIDEAVALATHDGDDMAQNGRK